MTTRGCLRFLLSFALALGAGAAAEAPDPLWEKAVDATWRGKDLIPGRIATRTEIYDGAGNKLEVVNDVDELTGWQGTTPLRKKETKKEILKKSGINLELRFDSNHRDNTFFAFREGRVTILRRTDEILNGADCAVFAFDQKPGGDDDEAQEGAIWVDKGTGLPVREETRSKKQGSKTLGGVMVLSFGKVLDGLTVPLDLRFETSGAMLFVKRKVTVTTEFQNWVRRPEPVAASRQP